MAFHSIKYTRAAEKDLARIRTYTTRMHGQDQAERYLAALNGVISRFADHPEIGISLEIEDESIREFSARSHVIRYQVRGNVIRILRIFHHREKRY